MANKVLSSNPLGRRLSIRQYKKAWFGGQFFRHKSPFLTFAQQNTMFLRDLVDEMGKRHGIRSALEIGPGNAPVLLGTRIPKIYFWEKSKKLSEELRKKAPNYAHEKMVVENKTLEKTAWQNYDLIVLNEVFSMVRPKDRVKQLKRIMAHSNNLVIIERLGVPMAKLGQVIVTIEELEGMIRILQAGEWNLECRGITSREQDYLLIVGSKN